MFKCTTTTTRFIAIKTLLFHPLKDDYLGNVYMLIDLNEYLTETFFFSIKSLVILHQPTPFRDRNKMLLIRSIFKICYFCFLKKESSLNCWENNDVTENFYDIILTSCIDMKLYKLFISQNKNSMNSQM